MSDSDLEESDGEVVPDVLTQERPEDTARARITRIEEAGAETACDVLCTYEPYGELLYNGFKLMCRPRAPCASRTLMLLGDHGHEGIEGTKLIEMAERVGRALGINDIYTQEDADLDAAAAGAPAAADATDTEIVRDRLTWDDFQDDVLMLQLRNCVMQLRPLAEEERAAIAKACITGLGGLHKGSTTTASDLTPSNSQPTTVGSDAPRGKAALEAERFNRLNGWLYAQSARRHCNQLLPSKEAVVLFDPFNTKVAPPLPQLSAVIKKGTLMRTPSARRDRATELQVALMAMRQAYAGPAPEGISASVDEGFVTAKNEKTGKKQKFLAGLSAIVMDELIEEVSTSYRIS